MFKTGEADIRAIIVVTNSTYVGLVNSDNRPWVGPLILSIFEAFYEDFQYFLLTDGGTNLNVYVVVYHQREDWDIW